MKLTKEQQKLVEDNHSLIYFYAKKYNVSIEDYYDVLALALCYAASNYDPKKGAFSTLAIKSMHFKMQNEFAYNTKQSQIPIDKMTYYENSRNLENTIPLNESPERIVIGRMSYNDKWNNILNLTNNEKHKNILRYKLQGLTCQEIGKKVNITHQNVSHTLRKIKAKALEEGLL